MEVNRQAMLSDCEMPKKSRKSFMWNFFTRASDGSISTAVCNVCKKDISFKSSISNLKKHLERKHPAVKLDEHKDLSNAWSATYSDTDGTSATTGQEPDANSGSPAVGSQAKINDRSDVERHSAGQKHITNVAAMQGEPSSALTNFWTTDPENEHGRTINRPCESSRLTVKSEKLPSHSSDDDSSALEGQTGISQTVENDAIDNEEAMYIELPPSPPQLRQQKRNVSIKDDCSTYGEYVASELRSFSFRTRTVVKHLINNALFKAAMGRYENIEFVSPPSPND